MVAALRAMVLDLGAQPEHDDATLAKLVAAGALQASRGSTFVNEYVVSIASPSIEPDPTLEATRDDAFVNLACMKAACVLDRGRAAVAAGQAIAVVDGRSSVDLRGVASARSNLLRSGGWCQAFRDAKLEHDLGASSAAGTAIMTPFRSFANQACDRR